MSRRGWSAFTYPFNLTGNPAITPPCGWNGQRLAGGACNSSDVDSKKLPLGVRVGLILETTYPRCLRNLWVKSAPVPGFNDCYYQTYGSLHRQTARNRSQFSLDTGNNTLYLTQATRVGFCTMRILMHILMDY